MSITTRIVTFGVVSGLIWSLIAFHPSAAFAGDKSPLLILAIGIMTGIAVSFALKAPLRKYGLWRSVLYGLLALPLGGFIYGFLFGLACTIGASFAGDGGGFQPAMPFVFGFYGAFISAVSMYYLFPVAILTTFLLGAVIRRGQEKKDAA